MTFRVFVDKQDTGTGALDAKRTWYGLTGPTGNRHRHVCCHATSLSHSNIGRHSSNIHRFVSVAHAFRLLAYVTDNNNNKTQTDNNKSITKSYVLQFGIMITQIQVFLKIIVTPTFSSSSVSYVAYIGQRTSKIKAVNQL